MITYPVDVQNTRWAVYNTTSSELVKRNQRWPRADGMEIESLNSDLIPLLEVSTTKPVFDPATEKVVVAEPVIDETNNTLTQAWQIAPFTQQEQDEYADRQANKIEIDGIKSVYQDLKNGTGTAGDRISRVESVLAFMLKRDYQP